MPSEAKSSMLVVSVTAREQRDGRRYNSLYNQYMSGAEDTRSLEYKEEDLGTVPSSEGYSYHSSYPHLSLILSPYPPRRIPDSQ